MTHSLRKFALLVAIGSSLGLPQITAAEFAFVTDRYGNVYAYQASANGSLKYLRNGAATSGEIGLASRYIFTPLSPDFPGSITELQLNTSSGFLTNTGRIFPGLPLHVAPTGRTVYSASEDHTGALNIHALSINPADGSLAEISGSPYASPVSNCDAPPRLNVDPRGRFLYAYCLQSPATLAVWPIGADGGLRPAGVAPFPNCIIGYESYVSAPLVFDDSGRFAYCGVDPSQPVSNIRGFSVDSVTGELTELPGSPFPYEVTPHAAKGGLLFTFGNPIGGNSADLVQAFTIDPATGNIATAGAPTSCSSNLGDVRIYQPTFIKPSPEHGFLYVACHSLDGVVVKLLGLSFEAASGFAPLPGSPFFSPHDVQDPYVSMVIARQ